MTQGAISEFLGPKLSFVQMTNIFITNSKIISRQLVLSLRKQLRLYCLEIERFKQRPLVTQTWNCIDGDSLCMANSSAHEYTSDKKEKKIEDWNVATMSHTIITHHSKYMLLIHALYN
jgi:hypothetical protein